MREHPIENYEMESVKGGKNDYLHRADMLRFWKRFHLHQ